MVNKSCLVVIWWSQCFREVPMIWKDDRFKKRTQPIWEFNTLHLLFLTPYQRHIPRQEHLPDKSQEKRAKLPGPWLYPFWEFCQSSPEQKPKIGMVQSFLKVGFQCELLTIKSSNVSFLSLLPTCISNGPLLISCVILQLFLWKKKGHHNH